MALPLLLWFTGAAVAVGVYRNVPVLDDWTYAWSVERLLNDGRFEVLDWSAVYPLGAALWGTAWSWVFGFSFVTLRVSTLVLALVACGALYLILRELDASPSVARLGALSVAVNPVFLLLSSSFMTDVPFVTFTLLALLCYMRALRRGDAHLLWWGGLWACASCIERQIGILTPIAALPLLFSPPPLPRIRRSTVIVALAVPWVVMLIGLVALTSAMHPTGEMTKLTDRLSYLLQIPLTTYIGYNIYVLTTMAFYALPALLAMATVSGLWRKRTLLVAATAAAAIMLAFAGEIPLPLRPGNTWTLTEVGGSRALINGGFAGVDLSAVEFALRGAGLFAAALMLLSILGRSWGSAVPNPAARRLDAMMQRLRDSLAGIAVTPRTPLVVYLAGYLLLANVLWMYNDRYLLVLLPVVAALALGQRALSSNAPRVAWIVTAVFALVAIVGTRDAIRFNQAIRDSWQALVDSGVQPSDIDAGYAWTGWVLYAHPANLARGLTVKDVPWITSRRQTPYVLSKSQLAGYDIARVVAWDDDAPWPGPDRLLVLKRRAAKATAMANIPLARSQ